MLSRTFRRFYTLAEYEFSSDVVQVMAVTGIYIIDVRVQLECEEVIYMKKHVLQVIANHKSTKIKKTY